MEQASEPTVASVWSEISGRLRGNLTDQTFVTWFGDVSVVGVSGEGVVLGVPNDFTRSWIDEHFRGLLNAALPAAARPAASAGPSGTAC